MQHVKLTWVVAQSIAALLLGCASSPSSSGGAVEGATTTDAVDESTGAPDVELDAWPADYRDFIEDMGGSRFVEVEGVRMHYVEVGPADGEVVLLVHGIPSHAYLWRDVIPHLRGYRVIALDLVGFGRSDRPDGVAYTPAMHVDYLDGFVDRLDLDRVHLVAHDLGGPVGLHWASENSDRLASVTMFETLWSTLPGLEVLPGPFAKLITGLRTPGVGEALVGEQNVLLANLSTFTVGGLTPEEEAVYLHPWAEAEDRVRVLLPAGPRAFPIPEDPAATAFVSQYQAFLASSSVPKLVLDVRPGLLSSVAVPGPDGSSLTLPALAVQTFPKTEVVALEPGGHFVQEDLGEALGTAISSFLRGR